MTSITTIDEALAAIWQRSGYDRGFISNPFAGDDAARLGLIRTARVLEGLGHPERDYPIVHVAGSKGKGSTASFVDSIVRSAGRRSGRFLSPHLHSYAERFVVDDHPIGQGDFVRLVGDILAAAEDAERVDEAMGQLTAWELSTAMALRWFSLSSCDIAVVEVGLGGTLDATNVVDPAVSVITTLDYEHTAILGSTMAEIAGNKAGIIKPGRPVLSAVQPADALPVIAARAKAVGAPLQVAGRDWVTTGTDRCFAVVGAAWRHDALASSLIGQHQVSNAGLAIATTHELARLGLLPQGDAVDDAIRQGVESAFIPGRFEVVRVEPGVTFVLDGAHSPVSTRALAAAIRERFPERDVTMVVAMLDDKDPNLLTAPLLGVTDRWLVAAPQSPRALDAEILIAALRKRSVLARTAATVAEAVLIARSTPLDNRRERVIVITGSLTTVAEGRVALGLA